MNTVSYKGFTVTLEQKYEIKKALRDKNIKYTRIIFRDGTIVNIFEGEITHFVEKPTKNGLYIVREVSPYESTDLCSFKRLDEASRYADNALASLWQSYDNGYDSSAPDDTSYEIVNEDGVVVYEAYRCESSDEEEEEYSSEREDEDICKEESSDEEEEEIFSIQVDENDDVVTREFKSIFNGGDSIDRMMYNTIPEKSKPKKLKKHLIKLMENVDKANWELKNWIRFKYEILKSHKDMCDYAVLNWGVPGTSYPLMKLNWKLIENDVRAMYIVHMMVEGNDIGWIKIPSVFDVLDIEF